MAAETTGLTQIPANYTVWSNEAPVPAIGDRVNVTMNGLGMATVTGYWTSEYTSDTKGEVVSLGVEVSFDAPPAWFIKQNGGKNVTGRVVGAEIRVLSGLA